MKRFFITFLISAVFLTSCGYSFDEPNDCLDSGEYYSYSISCTNGFNELDTTNGVTVTPSNTLSFTEEHATEPLIEYYHGLPIGDELTEQELRYFSESLANAINNENYFYGEFSQAWAINGLGEVEFEIYENVQQIKESRRYFWLILTSPTIDIDKTSYHQEEVYFSLFLSMDMYGTLSQHLGGSMCNASIEGLRSDLVASNQWPTSNNYSFLGSTWTDIPPVFPPNNPDYFTRIDDIIEIIREAVTNRFLLYTGLQEKYYHGLYNLDTVEFTESIYFCVVIEEEKYFGHCFYHSMLYPVLSIEWPDNDDMPFRYPYDDKEAFILEQIISLGNVYEIGN